MLGLSVINNTCAANGEGVADRWSNRVNVGRAQHYAVHGDVLLVGPDRLGIVTDGCTGRRVWIGVRIGSIRRLPRRPN